MYCIWLIKAPVSAEYTAYCRPLPFYFPGAVDRESFPPFCVSPRKRRHFALPKSDRPSIQSACPFLSRGGSGRRALPSFYHAVKNSLKEKITMQSSRPCARLKLPMPPHNCTAKLLCLSINSIPIRKTSTCRPLSPSVAAASKRRSIGRLPGYSPPADPGAKAVRALSLSPQMHRFEFPLVRPAVCPPSAQTQPPVCICRYFLSCDTPRRRPGPFDFSAGGRTGHLLYLPAAASVPFLKSPNIRLQNRGSMPRLPPRRTGRSSPAAGGLFD